MKKTLISTIFVFVASAVCAAVQLGSPFADGMVLQRERPVPVWGKAAPGEKVTVSFGGQTLQTTANDKGAWRVTLAPMKANATAQTLRVEPGAIEVKDVLVGEVWLASGQSNMAFRFTNSNPRTKEKLGSLLAQITTRPLIRYAEVEKKSVAEERDYTKVQWKAFTPHFLLNGGSSAVATYFAIYLHDAINVPVGIVGCAWGGTNIDAWIPHTEESAKTAKVPRKPSCRAGYIYRGSIAPLKPFSMRGVIWYQGEADAIEAWKYEERMKMLYDSWGKLFENEKWPFLFAQLAPYEYNIEKSKRDLVALQLAQASFAEKEPNAHMTTINDIGNLWDIHPNDKSPVGMRLAALALQHVYGFKDVKADAPTAVSAKALENGKVEITFRHGDGLYVYNDNRSVEIGLEIAGADGVFHPAILTEVDKRGVIDSKTGKLIVCSKQVSKPETVRYLFKSPWFGALRNRGGIPVGPFKLKVEGNSNKSLDNSSFNVDRAWQLKAPYQAVKEHVPGFLWIEAENFAEYGGWILDTQFAHKMGSGYLLAPGVGVPVSDATTTVSVKKSGKYRIWARCKDWVPEHHPGRFTLKIDGKGIGREFGASGRADWTWEDGGIVELKSGECKINLVDKSGYYARCDAIVLANDLQWKPAENAPALEQQRAKMNGEPEGILDGGTYDVVVVGGGAGGVPAAIAAARGGAKVAIVQDRPVFGGNISSELGVLLNGASGHPGYREGGIIEEAALDKAREAVGATLSFSRVFKRMLEAEKNITIIINTRVYAVEQNDSKEITSALAKNQLTGAKMRLKGKLFVDATGDGWLGYFAGAKYMFGREGFKDYNETSAPDVPDLTTMSGCLLGGYGKPRLKKLDVDEKWSSPVWAKILPEGFERKAKDLNFKWWLEHPGDIDDCKDPEFARDTLLKIFFDYWDWLKNKCPTESLRKEAARHSLVSLPYMNGRREGMRLKGDYVYTEHDALKSTLFNDRIGHTGWSLYTHNPRGVMDAKGGGFWLRHPSLPCPASIPYRILYSENIPNMFMAGRNVSCSHVGLGTLRVAATCAVMGQAVGTAAAGCIRYGLNPREYGKKHMSELQCQLIKDDQFIIDMKYNDPTNKAASGKASATSEFKNSVAGNVLDGYARTLKKGPSRGWISNPVQKLPQSVRVDLPSVEDIGEIRITFDSDFFISPKWVKHNVPKTLVKSYILEVSADGSKWETVADEKNSCRRLAVHKFPIRKICAIRLKVRETWGDPSARVFEIRCYK
jgi:hypothetical protein